MTAVDLFAGAGGATAGLQQAGVDVLGAVENDPFACASYKANHPDVLLKEADIRTVDPEVLRAELHLLPGELDLLKACPPCQGFSTLAKGDIDEDRNDLVLTVAGFTRAFRPRAILLENVPGLGRDARLGDLISELGTEGYRFATYVLDASALGVPQRRKRLIALGVADSVDRPFPTDLKELLPSGFDTHPTTVADAFSALRSQMEAADPLNVHRKPLGQVLARIKAIPVGGTRFDLPPELQLKCHKDLAAGRDKRSASTPYGRLRLDEAAPTMTTRCTTPACGRFIHPTEDRGITLREAAALQTFPATYHFAGNYGAIERQIGNAVPVRMAEALGLAVVAMLAA
jgi:DNA (cytosine-5)-methyltransferase 1